MNTQSLLALFLLGCVSHSSVQAHDDMSESIAKAKNKFHSYQSDPTSLLQAIQAGEYGQIYIRYHQCVWSEFESENEDGGCNGGEGDSWYMGNTQCYRANVAYSLYGVRAGEEVPAHVCRKKYYINSFFTKNGMEDLGSLLGFENYDEATSQCTMVDNGNADEEGEENNNGNSFQHNVQMYPNAQSYTTYCAGGKFVTAAFDGAYCTGQGELKLIDTLSDFNNEIDAVDCVLAYSTEENENEEESEDEHEGERKLESGDQEEGEGEENKSLWDVLSYSSACSVIEYPKGCPDPYGVKKNFDLSPRRATRGFWRHMYGIDWLTLVLFILGTFLMFLNCCIKDGKYDDGNKKRKIFGFRRGRSKSPSRSRGRSKSPGKTLGRSSSFGESTVDSFGQNANGKKRGLRGFFSRKK